MCGVTTWEKDGETVETMEIVSDFIFLGLPCWVFLAVHRLSSDVASLEYSLVAVLWLLLLRSTGSGACGLQ